MRFNSRLAGAAVVFFFLAGCALAPTKVREVPERRYEGAGALASPIKIVPETVVIDARPQFEFSMVHVPHSVNMRWSDFTDPQPENRGVLLTDLGAIARRLATAGLQPSSHVVVVGKGLGGHGEEGRIAWMLGYLGFSNVQFATFESLKFRYSNIVEENALKSQQPWRPEPVESLLVTRAEVRFAINHNTVHQPAAFRQGSAPVLYRIIDVRVSDDYLGREGIGAARKIPNMEAINIPWKEFFDSSLRPRQEMLAKLTSVGVSPEHRIIVISSDGVTSGAVTMALRALGFANAGNYAGGIQDLMSAYRYEGE